MDRSNLSRTEAHGGDSSMEHSSSYASYCASDDPEARGIRERLREYRGMIISYLAEKMNTALLQAFLLIQLLTPVEADQVKRKQRRQQKASCLVDIVSRKRGTDLKVFVDQLKTHCPNAHGLLYVPVSTYNDGANQPAKAMSVPPGTSGTTTEIRTKEHSRDSSPRCSLEAIERAYRRATTQLSNCLANPHYGLHMFVKELRTVLSKTLDIALITFDNGHTIMHEVIRLDRLEYLKALQYVGVWSKLCTLRNECERGSFSSMTPYEYAVKLKRTRIRDAFNDISIAEQSLHELDLCVREGDIRRFRELKDRYKQHIIRGSGSGPSTLEYACQSGVLPMLLDVIKTERELGCRRPSADKAVALCVDLGHHLLLQPLLEYVGGNINSIVVDGKSLTERAAVNGDIDTFRQLERLGATPAETVLALASTQNRLPFIVELLSGRTRILNLNFQDRRKKSAAHFAAEKGHSEVVQILLEKGLDITLKDKRKFTILHAAASGGNIPTLEVVLDMCEKQHQLHSMLTARDQYLGSERCFLVRGRDNDQSAWHYVEADRGRIDIFRKRTQGGAVDVATYGRVLKSGWGNSPSAEIIQEVEGMYDVVNANQEAALDMQALHVAIIKCHEAAAVILIKKMDDVGQPDRFGLTPLHLAAMRGLVKVIKELLAKGANRTVTDDQGRTPLDIAVANEQSEAASALTPVAEEDETEVLRRKLLDAYHRLSKERLEQEGQNQKRYMKSLLRDVIGDINDFMFDSLGEGPIAAESGSQHLTGHI